MALSNQYGGAFCCCGPFRTDVETGAKIVAILGIVFSLASASSALLVRPISAVGFFISFVLYLLVLFAQRRRNPSLYLPYLIITPIRFLVYLALCVVLAVTQATWLKQQMQQIEINVWLIWLPIVAVCALYEVVDVWFYSIIWRAYKVLKQEQTIEATERYLNI